MVSFTRSALAAGALFASVASAVEYISVVGSNFVVNSTSERFDIIGIDYQPGGSSGFNSSYDPLADPEACLRDAILMQQLGVNTVRVYNLDNDLDHNECVSIFNAAGIYLLLDVNSGTYGQYIDADDPASTYTLEYLEHIFGIVEAFAQFPNVIGFFAANELLNQDSSYYAPKYIRAVTRDLKEYISLHAPRDIPVGYSAADVSSMLVNTWNYLNCYMTNETDSKIDFFGLNDYEWCGDSTFTESGYDVLVQDFADASIPVFFSEYGCNDVEPRTFTNVPVLYGDEMSELSGGLVYEWTEETNDYGIIAVNSSTEVTLLIDYTYLMKEFDAIDISLLTSVNATAETQTATACAASEIVETASIAFYNAYDLPDRPSGADALISSGYKSASTGSLVSVTATTMPVTVYNYTGAEVTGLALVELACNEYNYPGLVQDYTSTSASCAYSTATGSSSSSSSSGSSDSSSAAGQSAVINGQAMVAVGAVLVSFLAGTLIL